MADKPEQDAIRELRRKLALETAPLTRELDAAEAAAASEPRRSYWRSVGDAIKSPSFLQWAHDEFPQLKQELKNHKQDGHSRRTFLQLMGASIALAGLGMGCRRPENKIHPYNKKPVDVVIGKAMYFATTFVMAGRAIGVLAETHEGRPTKIEGNPRHPNSLGGTDVYAQASLLDLYDPDRSRNITNKGQVVARDAFVAQLNSIAKQFRTSHGAGLAIVMEDYASPAVMMLLEHIRKTMPETAIAQYEPANGSDILSSHWADLSKAQVIVAVDCDFVLTDDEGALNKQAFIAGRKLDGAGKMNRLYVAEPVPTATGTVADHRLRLPGAHAAAFLEDLLAVLKGKQIQSSYAKWIGAVAEDLKAAGVHSAVLVGRRQPPAAQLLGRQINAQLRSEAVSYRGRPELQRLDQIVERINAGQIQTLLLLGGNPAFNAPADLDFAKVIGKVPLSIRIGTHEDETSALCTWHAPAAHYLESWGDAVAGDGTVSIVQPMIEPLFGGFTPLEVLARISAYPKTDPYEIVRDSFARIAGSISEDAWKKFAQEGVLSGKKMALLPDAVDYDFMAEGPFRGEISAKRMEICFALSNAIFDGRFANNAWMQECPDPVTKLTWDNAALLSEATAKAIGVETGDMVRIELAGRSLEIAAFIVPGVADWSITLPLGYGRTRGGVICLDTGVNAYALRTSRMLLSPGQATGAKVTPTGRKYKLATTQEHSAMDMVKYAAISNEQAAERAIIREVTPEQLQNDPAIVRKMGEHAPIRLSIYTEPKLTGANQWGMAIDLNRCVSCNACVVACQSENNIPVVGKDEVLRGREMHWLRIDRYFQGENDDDVTLVPQPMMCQHCENAPCEPVCPVNATVHSPEGLNEMVYNRCIGTRYCSNNCPYKVRRFNFFDWNKGTIRENAEQSKATRDGQIEPDPTKGFSRPQVLQPPMQEMLKMAENPNVTVRMRGVMEKCTYCVQRIESAKIAFRSQIGQGPANAQADGAAAIKLPDGMVTSACAQVCPTQAIIFGDKNDPNGKLAKFWDRNNPRTYEVLEHLFVKPRTHYLAKVRNVNPKLGDH